jgi:putative adhesin Stv-like protein
MASTPLSGIGTIWTGGSSVNASGKTLIISAHGRMTGTKFTPAYTSSVQFASDKYGALMAAVEAAINGTVTAIEVATPGSKVEDHALAFYEHDPSTATIVSKLANSSFDVLTIDTSIYSTRLASSPTLSGVMTKLKQQSLQYPAILGLFCRVVKDVTTGKEIKSHDITGKKHATVAQQGAHMKNAISIAQALKAKGLAT